jgi:hypothetical protein
MKREVEKYIKINMDRALLRWNQAQEQYEIGETKSAADLYADAMQLYYKCAQDLIDGTGFVDRERSKSMNELLQKINSVIKLYDIQDSWKIEVDILDDDTVALNGVGHVTLSQLRTRDIMLDKIADEILSGLGDEYSRDSLTWYLADGTMINNGTIISIDGEEEIFDEENEAHCKLVNTSQVLLMVD